MRAEVLVFDETDWRSRLETPPVTVDPGVWPVPEPISAEVLERALGRRQGPRVLLLFHGMPHGDCFWLDIEPDGSVLAKGEQLHGTKRTEPELRAGRMLTRVESEALRAVVGRAPFAAFRHDPQWRTSEDGQVVRLLVATGPAAFAASSQSDDFLNAGLEPLLEHLRLIVRNLPDVEGEK